MTSRSARIVVAGASMAGLRAAEQLRAAGWTEAITLVGDEPHMPYNRPPLSKEVLAGKAPFESLAFRPRASVADAEWRLGAKVVATRLAENIVEFDGGEALSYDGLVVATGMRPRRLRCPGPLAGRHTVRTIDDAQGLRQALTRPGARVVVVGGGFIGCEVAATAVALGAREVTVVDPLPLPMVGPLGELLARVLLKRHEERGVRFALGAGVTGFTGDDHVTGVALGDGTVLPADVVVESVGSVANTEWLEGNGLDLSDGVLTDEHLRVGGRPDVVAVGDVARFPNARYDGVPRRVEHWCIPTDTAKHAAKTLVARLAGTSHGLSPFAPLPTFWSDQHDFRLQCFGAPVLGKEDVRVLDGDLDGDVVVGYHASGRLAGVVALGGPAAAAAASRYRAELLEQPALTAKRTSLIMNTVHGFFFPKTASGASSLVPSPPWLYSGDLLTVEYRTDPARVRELLPEPLELADEDPGAVAMIWADWQSCSASGEELLDPVLSQYKEAFAVVRCKYRGETYSRCVYIWVDKDFAIARGLHQGYPKKLGSIQQTRPHPYGPAPRIEAGARFGATLAAADRRLAQTTVTLREPSQTNGFVNAHPMAHHRWLPSIEKGKGLALDELIESGAASFEAGQAWRGDAELELFEAPTEELARLEIREPIAAYYRQVGVVWDGGRLLESGTSGAE